MVALAAGNHVCALSLEGMRDGEIITNLYQSRISFRLSSYNFHTGLNTFQMGVSPLVPTFTSGYDFVGSFRIGSSPEFHGARQVYYVEFPVWFPWLILAAGGYGFVRFTEKRAVAVMEKDLASQKAVGETP